MMNIAVLLGMTVTYLWLLAIAAAIGAGLKKKHGLRSTNKIVEDFRNYVKKGRKRVPEYGRAYGWIAFIVIVPFQALWFLIWASTGSMLAGLLLSVSACSLLFRQIAIGKDRVKKTRHNGIAIGYEYTHPAGKEGMQAGAEGEEFKKIAYGGSKGVYEVSLMSEPSPHMMVVGKSGEGKSTTLRTMLSRAYAKYNIPFLILDWSGEYRKLGEITNLWAVPKSLRVNPLLLRGMSGERRSGIAAETLQFSLNLTNLQAQKVRELLMELYDTGTEPTMQMLHWKVTESIDTEKFRDIKVQNQYIANKLRQTFEIFGSEPEGFWESYEKACNVVELHGLTTAEKSLVTYSILQRIIEEFKGERRVKLLIALDDAHDAVKSAYGLETPITKIVREGRKYGFGLIIATQMLADVPNAVITNTSLKIVHPNHGPEDVPRIERMLHLSEIEKEIMRRMPIGHCFVLDDHLLQSGRAHPAYVEVDELDYNEMGKMLAGNPKEKIKEAKSYSAKRPAQNAFSLMKREGIEIPSAAVYRFLLALGRAGSLQQAYQLLKQRGWITSDTTIYGTKGKPSLQERARAMGYLDAEGRLTEKALQLIDPEKLIARQKSNAGGEEHRKMMAKVILAIQERGNFAFVLSEQDSFDVGEIGIDPKAKGLWDYRKITAYEVQTNAIKEEIEKCMERAKRDNARLVLVADNEKTREEMKRITKDAHECIML